MTLIDLFDLFPDDDTAEAWFVEQRWPDSVACSKCGSLNVQDGTTHPTIPFRCRDCRRFFSVKTGGLMESSKIGYQKWAIAIFVLTTGIKGTSSMKLHRDLGITQKSAWYMAHRIRESWSDYSERFEGPVEVDETYIGGKERNKHKSKKLNAGRGAVGKMAVVGVRDRETCRVSAKPVSRTDKATLQGFVEDRTEPYALVYTDEAAAYTGMSRVHKSVRHGVGEYVRDQASTNGVESFWAMLKRGYQGTYHQMSPKHLHRYVNEFSGRHNDRPRDTADQMTAIAHGMVGKRLKYNELTGKAA